MAKPLYKALIGAIMARSNCEKTGNSVWFERHTDRIDKMVYNYLPSGSGIDNGCHIDLAACKPYLIVIRSSYHCMDENGFYDGWIDFTVRVTPSLYNDFDLTIRGLFGKYGDVRDYLYDTFDMALRQEVEEFEIEKE